MKHFKSAIIFPKHDRHNFSSLAISLVCVASHSHSFTANYCHLWSKIFSCRTDAAAVVVAVADFVAHIQLQAIPFAVKFSRIQMLAFICPLYCARLHSSSLTFRCSCVVCERVCDAGLVHVYGIDFVIRIPPFTCSTNRQ